MVDGGGSDDEGGSGGLERDHSSFHGHGTPRVMALPPTR